MSDVVDFTKARLLRDVTKTIETLQADQQYGPPVVIRPEGTITLSEDHLAGRVNDHQTPETQVQVGAPASLRRVITLHCNGCGHDWIAPAIGRCPACHDEFVEARSEHLNVLPRA